MATSARLAESERRRVIATSTNLEARLVLGWEEWISLPALGLPAIKAKIDTGAKTSALHAQAIEPITKGGSSTASHVRFSIRPAPRRPDIEVVCTAPLIDRRTVTSSNGIPENRYVIVTEVTLAGHSWPIEITLSDRRDMNYRMLLGRQALQTGAVVVDPGASFIQPKLGFKCYPGYNRTKSVRKSR
jgi:ribosomal protein S6--L-glutamate ligase